MQSRPTLQPLNAHIMKVSAVYFYVVNFYFWNQYHLFFIEGTVLFSNIDNTQPQARHIPWMIYSSEVVQFSVNLARVNSMLESFKADMSEGTLILFLVFEYSLLSRMLEKGI